MQRSINNLCSHHSTYLVIVVRLVLGIRLWNLFSFERLQLVRKLILFMFLDLIMIFQREQRHGGSTSDLFPFKLL